jgi:hypothetical protein
MSERERESMAEKIGRERNGTKEEAAKENIDEMMEKWILRLKEGWLVGRRKLALRKQTLITVDTNLIKF